MLRSLGVGVIAFGLVLSTAGAVHAAPMADRDGDGVFDDLEQHVRQVPDERDVRVIVGLDADATRARAGRLEDRIESLEVKRRFGIVDAVAAVVDAGDVRALATAAGVAHVERDGVVRATNSGAQKWFGVTKARTDLPSLDGDLIGGADTYSAGDLVAAVIDSGIYTAHTDLDEGKVLAYQDFTDGSHFDSDLPSDPNGHGTHVAATIAGDGDGGLDGRGVAPGAGLVGLRVLGADGTGSSSNVIAAIDWVTNPARGVVPGVPNGETYGIEAINLSLGGDECSDGEDEESQAVNNAAALGYVVVVAAGNGSPSGCIGSPAAAANAITVGAMADVDAGGFYLANFSIRGPSLSATAPIKPDVLAPGVSIRSAKAGTAADYATYSGTSMSTPFVVGVALLMRDVNAALTPAEVKQRIMASAIDWGTPGTDNDHGAGRLDAYAALASAAAPGQLVSPPSGQPSFQQILQSLSGAGADRFFTITAQPGMPLAAGLTVANQATDFDMYLYNAAGKRVAAATTPHRQDELHLVSAAAGPYTLRVESWAGSGNFHLDISGGSAVETGDVPAPVNTTPPTVSGAPAEGSILRWTSNGSWTGTPTFTYEWERCSSAGDGCTGTGDIDGSYTVTSADSGHWLRLAVTAETIGGIATAYSASLAVPAGPPVVQVLPTIAGTAKEGAQLAVTTGTWGGTAPFTYTYRWERCEASNAVCTPIPNASLSSYTPAPADVGRALRATVTAANATGSATASAWTAVVTAGVFQQQSMSEPPVNELAPSIKGAARHGRPLRAEEGIWRGAAPIAFAYQWLRCNSIGFDCLPIPGASGSAYRPRAVDIERWVAVRVVASNGDGSATAQSQATGVVRAARPVNRTKPSIAGRAARGGMLRARGGSWWGTPKIRLSVTWLRCSATGRRCKPIARRGRYAPRAADVGHPLRVRVTAKNAAGSRRATSRPSAIVR